MRNIQILTGSSRLIVAVLVLCAVFAAPVSADGGGGVFYAVNSPFAGSLDNSEFQPRTLQQSGGFGYGIDGDGTKIGGFGLSFLDVSSNQAAGGFGGMLLGSYSTIGPFSFAGNGMLGIGGLHLPELLDGGGALSFLGQLDLELGFPITDWFQISGFAGVQFLLPVTAAYKGSINYPMMGLRFTWGSFR